MDAAASGRGYSCVAQRRRSHRAWPCRPRTGSRPGPRRSRTWRDVDDPSSPGRAKASIGCSIGPMPISPSGCSAAFGPWAGKVATEVSFNIRGERGSIDILAFHAPTGSLLVIEIKSVVPDLQAMLGVLDRKVRLAAAIARERGWSVRSVSRLLVLPDDRTARRRVQQHAATFEAALPARNVEVRRWLAAPAGRLAGLLFLTNDHQASARHRVAAPRGPQGLRLTRADAPTIRQWLTNVPFRGPLSGVRGRTPGW